MCECEEMKALVKDLIRILDIVEESDNGKMFRPNQISSCRVMDCVKIDDILSRLKEMTR
jgi:hypothetical protein